MSAPSNVRSVVPPWPIALSFGLLVVGRFVSSRLSFVKSPLYESLVPTLMTALLAVFWFWTPIDGTGHARRTAVAARFFVLTCGAYLVADVLLDLNPVARLLGHPVICSAGSSNPLNLDLFRPNCSQLLWPTLGRLYVPVYNTALIYPFARLFTDLRLDRSLPSSTALGPCAAFFFFALVTPALIQSVDPLAPTHLRWILLGVPLLTVLLVAHYLRERRIAGGRRRSTARELWELLWASARLPVLFALAELMIILVGVGSSF